MAVARVQGPLLVLILGIGISLRWQVAEEVGRSPIGLLLENPATDMKTFVDQSALILEDPLLRRDAAPYYQSPLYPYYLATLRAVSGGDATTALRRQAVLDSASIPATWLLGRVVHGPAAGLIAALLVALHGPSVLHASIPLSATLETTLGTLFLALLLQSLFSDRRRDWIVAGLLGGLAVLARPNFLALLLLVPAFLRLRKREVTDITRRSLATFFACGLALQVPVVVRNVVVAGTPAILPTSGAVNFRIGNSQDSIAGGFHYPEQPLLSIFTPAFVKLNLRKLAAFYNSYEWPQNLNYLLCREYLHGLQLPLLTLRLLMPLALAGALLVFVREDRRARWLAAALALLSLSISLFFVVDRFRLPLVPGYAVLAAILLLALADWRTSWPYGLVAIALVPLLHRPPPHPIRYNDHGLIQDMILFKRDWVNGVPIAEKFARDFPGQPEVLGSLGSHYMVLRRPEIGAPFLEACLRLNPDHVPALRDLTIYYRDVLKQPERAAPLARRLEGLGHPVPAPPGEP